MKWTPETHRKPLWPSPSTTSVFVIDSLPLWWVRDQATSFPHCSFCSSSSSGGIKTCSNQDGKDKYRATYVYYALQGAEVHIYLNICWYFCCTPMPAQVGLQRSLGHCGQRTMRDTQKIDIVLAKRFRVRIQNIIMLPVSLCQYDLACQRILSGMIACATFRRLCMLVPH